MEDTISIAACATEIACLALSAFVKSISLIVTALSPVLPVGETVKVPVPNAFTKVVGSVV